MYFPQRRTQLSGTNNRRYAIASHRQRGTNNQQGDNIKRKVKLLTNSRCAETSVRSYAFPSDLPCYLYNSATPKAMNTWSPSVMLVLKEVQNNSDNINDVHICEVPAARLKALNKHNTHNAHRERVCCQLFMKN